MIAALQGNSQDGDELLSAARGLTNAARNFLKLAEPSKTQNRKQILDAAAEVGVTGGFDGRPRGIKRSARHFTSKRTSCCHSNI